MAKNNNLTDFLTNVADAIRYKKNTSEKINPQDFFTHIVTIGSEGGDSGVTPNAVRLLDCDGTLLHSYSADDFLTLTDLPELPTREGLICQGWNWNIADAQSFVVKHRKLDIGATYITDDGKTRLYIKIAAEGRMTVPLYFSQTVANGVTIDWGDGSATQTLSDTGTVNTTHTYADIGEYTISLNPSSECTLGLGNSSYCVMGSTENNGKVYCNMLQAVEIGKNVTSISNYAFRVCYSLASVVIPDSVTNIGSYAFSNCYSLASVVIPDSVTSIGSYAFSNCYSLASVVISQGVTLIGEYMFSYCYSLASVVIPDSVTSIGSSAFFNCYGMAYYDFRASKLVPTLSTGAFGNIPSDCKIVVPDSLYDSWIAATNWSTYASNIVKASEFNG